MASKSTRIASPWAGVAVILILAYAVLAAALQYNVGQTDYSAEDEQVASDTTVTSSTVPRPESLTDLRMWREAIRPEYVTKRAAFAALAKVWKEKNADLKAATDVTRITELDAELNKLRPRYNAARGSWKVIDAEWKDITSRIDAATKRVE